MAAKTYTSKYLLLLELTKVSFLLLPPPSPLRIFFTMSDYSSQPVEDFDPTDYALRNKDSHKFKRAKPLFEKSMAGRLATAQYLHDQGYESTVEVKWTHKQLRPEFSELWEIGPSNAKCIAHIVENSMGFV